MSDHHAEHVGFLDDGQIDPARLQPVVKDDTEQRNVVRQSQRRQVPAGGPLPQLAGHEHQQGHGVTEETSGDDHRETEEEKVLAEVIHERHVRVGGRSGCIVSIDVVGRRGHVQS